MSYAMNQRTIQFTILLQIIPIMLAGCVTEDVPQRTGITNIGPTDFVDARPNKRVNPLAEKKAETNLPPIQACAHQLHDIEGALLQYYLIHKAFPDTLEELQSVAGSDLIFNCPESHAHYTYVPAGKQSAGRTKRLLIHDSDDAHDGNRWCVIMTPAYAGNPPSLEVVAMPPELFRTYLLVSEQR